MIEAICRLLLTAADIADMTESSCECDADDDVDDEADTDAGDDAQWSRMWGVGHFWEKFSFAFFSFLCTLYMCWGWENKLRVD